MRTAYARSATPTTSSCSTKEKFASADATGTGTAARLVTGKSPHELNHMANTGVVKTGEMIRQSPGALLSAAKAFRKP